VSIENNQFVTIGGECFEVKFQSEQAHPDRDGVSYLFHIVDLTKDRGKRFISLYRSGPDKLWVSNYDARIETVRVNTFRRAFDSGTLHFDARYDEGKYRELPLTSTDFNLPSPATDMEVRQFIIHKAYWLSWKYCNRFPVQFDEPVDLEYLGVGDGVVGRNQWLLEEDGLLERSKIPGLGRPTARLVKTYESTQSTELPNERVFPPGTQYEAFKLITGILRSAKREILIADNYLNEDVLDMLAAVPSHPAVKLLTHKPRPDFRVASQRFKVQYRDALEVKVHSAEIHDRAVVVDDDQFYALGASIKDMGGKLSLLNKLQDPASINKLRSTLQTIWSSSSPL